MFWHDSQVSMYCIVYVLYNYLFLWHKNALDYLIVIQALTYWDYYTINYYVISQLWLHKTQHKPKCPHRNTKQHQEQNHRVHKVLLDQRETKMSSEGFVY